MNNESPTTKRVKETLVTPPKKGGKKKKKGKKIKRNKLKKSRNNVTDTISEQLKMKNSQTQSKGILVYQTEGFPKFSKKTKKKLYWFQNFKK